MNQPNLKVKKIILTTAIAVISVIVLFIAFASPVTKYLVEKYDVEYTGRQIKIDWVYVNPFTGYVHFDGIKIYEGVKDTVFFSAEGLDVNFSMIKLLNRTYEISELTLDRPWGIVIQNQKKKELNFDDLIERFSSKSSGQTERPIHFNVLHVKVIDGEIHYREKIIPINYFIKNVDIESPGKYWDTDTLAANFSFVSGEGKVKGSVVMNTKNQNYSLTTNVRNFSMEIIRQYLWELINYGLFKAHLDADVKVSGNLANTDSINIVGQLAINNFHLGKTATEDYASFKQIRMIIHQLNPDAHKYLFDSIKIDHPFFKYEQFDSLDNVQAMFGKKGSNISDVTRQAGRFNLVIEIARYVKTLSKKFFASQYRINSLMINKGKLEYDDYSLSEQFSLAAHSLNFKADSIHKSNKRVHAFLKASVLRHGSLAINLSINPIDSNYFDLQFHAKKVPVSAFNPYLISKTSFPLDRGSLEISGLWNVRDGFIDGTNHVLVINPRVSERLRNKDTKWIPMPLIMSVIRERGNVMDYEIPVKGSLKSPDFKLTNVIGHIIENILVKPPTTPYGLEIKNLENEIDEELTVHWAMRQVLLEPHQKKFVDKIAEFLKDTPEASIVVSPKEYETKEKEYILYFETKKKYFLSESHKHARDFSQEDSLTVEKMSIKDLRQRLVKDIPKSTRDTTMFTIQDRCYHYLGGEKIVNRKFAQLVKARDREFISYFKEKGTDGRVKIHKSESQIPYNGFSFFKIAYEGRLPESLLKAHREMMELNQEVPRKKYFKNKVDRRLVKSK